MGAEPKTRTLKLKNITVDAAIQPRAAGLDEATVEEYAAAMRAGAAFPPCRVFKSAGGSLWLSRGFHRYAGAERAGLAEIECEVFNGDRKDAVIDAACSNTDHGLKRTIADKRKAVAILLGECPEWSDGKVAQDAGVSHTFVAGIRAQLATLRVEPAPTTRVGKDGKVRKVTPKPAPSDPEPEPEATPDELTANSPDDEPEPLVVADPAPPAPEPKPKIKNPPIKDGLGNVVPACVADTFGDPMLGDAVARITAAHAELVSVERHVVTTLNKKAEFWPYAQFGECAKSLLAAADRAAEAAAQLSNGMPFCVCPKCKGEGCKDCRNAGYWTRHRHEQRNQYGD